MSKDTKVRFPNMPTYDNVSNFKWEDFKVEKEIGNSLFGWYDDIYVEVIKENKITDLLNEGHYHEMLDRLHVVCSNIEDHLLQHPVCKVDKEITVLVDEALNKLAEAYQITGNRF